GNLRAVSRLEGARVEPRRPGAAERTYHQSTPVMAEGHPGNLPLSLEHCLLPGAVCCQLPSLERAVPGGGDIDVARVEGPPVGAESQFPHFVAVPLPPGGLRRRGGEVPKIHPTGARAVCQSAAVGREGQRSDAVFRLTLYALDGELV